MTTILLVALASLAVYCLLVHRRHICPHHDPLCRRGRPCIACYRELFNDISLMDCQFPDSKLDRR